MPRYTASDFVHEFEPFEPCSGGCNRYPTGWSPWPAHPVTGEPCCPACAAPPRPTDAPWDDATEAAAAIDADEEMRERRARKEWER
ncbi:MAG TPA: hypothetical protein VMW48_13460 [Vicinamibacterales bacterium]|nr:hypothetical protein [Vicinamibacterales bacterium]